MAEEDTSTTNAFRLKVNFMRTWKPLSTPSNRDRLELYALHKQAVSGDAPVAESSATNNLGVADRAKWNAWRGKRGLSQQAAMSAYITECDRQLRVYDSAGQTEASTKSSSDGGLSAGQTPQNTPATAGAHGDDVGILTPRGLAAVPLLCAAAAENRTSYLARLKGTGDPNNGWWVKQEPLCGDPGTALATPENLLLWVATLIEKLSLSISNGSSTNVLGILPVSVVQSFLWPTHNVLLAMWIVLIFIFAISTSSLQAIATLLFGSRRTNISLSQIFREEIVPSSRAASTLCEPHQAISIRLVGLALMPLVTICDVSQGISTKFGFLVGSGLFVLCALLSWWYWIITLPWIMFAATAATFFTLGWCFAIIELANNTTTTAPPPRQSLS